MMASAQGVTAVCYLVVNDKVRVIVDSEPWWVIVLWTRVIICEVHVTNMVRYDR